MNRSQVLAAIRAMSSTLVLRVTDGEYRVTFATAAIQALNGCSRMEAIERAEAIAYYTCDGADAVGTAARMVAAVHAANRF